MQIHHTPNDSSSVLDSPDSSCWVELTGILHEQQQLYAVFRAGPAERICRVNASDLTSFTAFQQRVAKELCLWVHDASEYELTPTARAKAWSAAVERALARGS